MAVTLLPHGGALAHVTLATSQLPAFEPWCQQHLRGPWRVVARYVISSGHTRIDLRVDTAADLALVQLTWL